MNSQNYPTEFGLAKSMPNYLKELRAILVKKAQDTGTQVETRVQEMPGLSLLAYPSGIVCLYWNSRLRGSGRRKRLANWGDISFTELLTLIQAAAHSTDKPELTVTQYFERYYLPKIIASKKSVKDDVGRYKKWIDPKIHGVLLSKLTAAECAAICLQSELVDLTPATRNHVRIVLISMLNYACKLGFLDQNPAKDVAKLPEDNVMSRVLTAAELHRFWLSLQEEQDRQAAYVIILLLNTGMRCGEVLSLTWAQVDLAGRVLTLMSQGTKNGKSRLVPLNEAAIAALAQLETMRSNTNNFVFHSSKTDGHIWFPRLAFERILTQAGIENFTPRDLRRNYACIALNAGVELHTVSKLLGHSSVQITQQRYAFLNQNSLQSAAKIVADRISAIAANDPQMAVV